MATPDEINERLLRLLDPRNFVRPMRDALDIVRNEEATFPPQPNRQRAKTFNNWLREVGRLPKAAFGQNVTTKQGTYFKARKKIDTRTVLKPSEKMMEKWKQMPIVIAMTADGLVGTGMNTASYSGRVQGELRTSFHQDTGWLTTKEAEEKHSAEITQLFVDQAMKIVGGDQVP